ncbi:MAG: hypothetical protein OXI56_07850 [bacterium]|nr:hypothetical protein [bacterium]MDE0601690.1 hypothetical protein [bacterium]
MTAPAIHDVTYRTSFDTLAATRRLESNEFTRSQAEAVVETLVDSQTALVTKDDLEVALSRQGYKVIRWQIAVGAWITGVVIALGVAVLANLP